MTLSDDVKKLLVAIGLANFHPRPLEWAEKVARHLEEDVENLFGSNQPPQEPQQTQQPQSLAE